MRYIIEKTGTGYSAYIEGLDGVVATGCSHLKVMDNMREAFKIHIKGLAEDGELSAFLNDPANQILTFRFADEDQSAQVDESKSKVEEFEKLMHPIIKYLCENHNPHTTIIVTITGAQLLEGKMGTKEILDYIED